jgi:hypothetical protein
MPFSFNGIQPKYPGSSATSSTLVWASIAAPVVSCSDAVNLALSAGGIVTISGLSFGESSFTPTASVSGTLFLFIGGVVI